MHVSDTSDLLFSPAPYLSSMRIFSSHYVAQHTPPSPPPPPQHLKLDVLHISSQDGLFHDWSAIEKKSRETDSFLMHAVFASFFNCRFGSGGAVQGTTVVVHPRPRRTAAPCSPSSARQEASRSTGRTPYRIRWPESSRPSLQPSIAIPITSSPR